MNILRVFCLFIFFVFQQNYSLGQDAEIVVLVRADDMGSTRSANYACLESFEKGIVKSIEIMVPGPWFEEAVNLVKDRKEIDMGVHLTLTSEWTNLKWRPLTHCPSLVDSDGYFLQNTHLLSKSNWKMEEMEKELRAQIELAIKKIPHISHLSEHMGCLSFSKEAKGLLSKLANEYGLIVKDSELKPFPQWSGVKVTAAEKQANLLSAFQQLKPGTYLLIEHPAYDDFEAAGMGHVGYEQVAKDRIAVLKAFTDKPVMELISKRKIKLISYKDL